MRQVQIEQIKNGWIVRVDGLGGPGPVACLSFQTLAQELWRVFSGDRYRVGDIAHLMVRRAGDEHVMLADDLGGI